ncbi:MAG: T9SS type A sorting domain-containing protein [Candidatus Cloacimonetes bacterium]|nr:T9SS type A sorting domain-containing protein [Candidatus Cloacimonadota bacterium]
MRKLILLLFVMSLSTLQFADGTPPEGTGTVNDPYQIAILDNLLWLSTTGSVWDGNYYFLQTADIDAGDTQNWNDGEGFSPIGIDQLSPFHGSYNGDNHIIDGLFINRTDIWNPVPGAFFGYTNEAMIVNLGVINVNITGDGYAGGIAGNINYSTISRCFVTGSISGGYNTGGIAGWSEASILTECYAEVEISGISDLGGIVGVNHNNSLVDRCFAIGSVSGNSAVGGLTGANDESTISESYTIVTVEGNGFEEGGFVGYNNNSTISNCVWNMEITSQVNGIGENIEGTIINLLEATTAEMHLMNIYTDIGWDFCGEIINGTEDIWDIHSALNNCYPYLSALEWSYIENGLLARFAASPTFGQIPLTVNFTDVSLTQFDIISWEWDFENDGVIDSNEQNPVWEYNEQGIYSVSLTVTDDANRETSTEVKLDYITVYNSFQPQGSGTETDPYLVGSLDNLLWISSNEDCWSSYFFQTDNIDASETQNWYNGAGFSPIGLNEDCPFEGNYDGGNHIIDGLYLNRPGSSYLGFFGYASGATIEALGLINIQVIGDEYLGGLVGYDHESLISECYVSGSIIGENDHIGGLVGWNDDTAINECNTRGNVSGNNHVGGLAGYNSGSQISDCYSRCSVTGDNADIGGLVGLNWESTLSNNYATGWVSGEDSVGGLTGTNNSTINNCIWNIETTGQTEGIGNDEGGTVTELLGLTTLDMQLMSSFTNIGWDFEDESINGIDDIWGIDDNINSGYPYICDIEFQVDNDNLPEFVNNLSIYPNPFNPEINIHFEIKKNSNVLVNIYNLKGQKVKTLVDGYYEAGKHSLNWQANNVASGIYLLRYETESGTEIKKITLLK